MMKVLMLNGSPKDNGNTARVLAEMREVFEKESVEVDYVHVGHLTVRGCTSCGACYKQGHCVIEDAETFPSIHSLQFRREEVLWTSTARMRGQLSWEKESNCASPTFLWKKGFENLKHFMRVLITRPTSI